MRKINGPRGRIFGVRGGGKHNELRGRICKIWWVRGARCGGFFDGRLSVSRCYRGEEGEHARIRRDVNTQGPWPGENVLSQTLFRDTAIFWPRRHVFFWFFFCLYLAFFWPPPKRIPTEVAKIMFPKIVFCLNPEGSS